MNLARGPGRLVATHTLAAAGCEIAIDAGVHAFALFWQTDSSFDYRSEAGSRTSPSAQTINATYSGWDRISLTSFEQIGNVPEAGIIALNGKYWFYRDAANLGVMVTTSRDVGV